jgi:hypothetical protein
MKAISKKSDDLWGEVERALKEHTASGYKMACIEAQKVFYHLLKQKGYPTKNMKQVLTIFGWKLTNKKALQSALEKTELIKNSFDYTLSSFETEDIVASYAKAIQDFSGAKSLSWQRKVGLFWDNYLSIKSSFAKKAIIGIILFFVIVKLLSSTKFGVTLLSATVALSNFFFSWFLVVIVGAGILVFVVFGLMTLFEKNKSKIREIK